MEPSNVTGLGLSRPGQRVFQDIFRRLSRVEGYMNSPRDPFDLYENIYSMRVRRDGQSIPNNANTNIVFDTTSWDPSGMLAANGFDVEIPVDGHYEVHCFGKFPYQMWVESNGVEFLGASGMGAGAGRVSCSTVVALSAGTILNVVMFQNSGGAVVEGTCRFMVGYRGPEL